MNNSNIHGLEQYSNEQLDDIIRDFIEFRINENYLDVEVQSLFFHGSRVRGTSKLDSDFDVVVYYFGDEREDTVFNILNESPRLKINNIIVDFNPIRPDETGYLDDYIRNSNNYDIEILKNK